MNLDAIYDENGNLKIDAENHEGIKQHIISCPWLLKIASHELQNDFTLVSEAVSKEGLVLKYATPNLRKNKKIVSLAIKDSEYAFLYADKSLQENIGFCLHALKLNPSLYPLLSDRLRTSTRIIARAIRWRAINALDIPSHYLLNNSLIERFFLLNSDAVKYLKDAAGYSQTNTPLPAVIDSSLVKDHVCTPSHQTNKAIQSDAEHVLAAMKKSPFEIRHAHKSLLHNRSFVYQACKIYPDAFSYADASLKHDRQFITQLMKLSPSILKFASAELLNDKELALKLVKENGLNIRSLSYSLKQDIDIGYAAVESEPLAIRYLKHWMIDARLLKSAVAKNAFSILHADIANIAVEDLEQIACTVVDNFPNDKETVMQSYDLIFENNQIVDLKTQRSLLIKETISRKFSHLNYSLFFALHVFHNFKKLKSYYGWWHFFYQFAKVNTIIAKIYLKDGFKSDDILTDENGSKYSLLKRHFPYGYDKFNGLGSLRKNMIHEYAKLITNDVFELSLIKLRFSTEGVISRGHFKAIRKGLGDAYNAY